MATYKKTTNTTAAYGEISPAVLELQQKLNALGAGLKLDSTYGPLTQAAATKYATQLNAPAAPVAPVVKEKFTYTLSPEEEALRDALGTSSSYFKKQGAAKVDEKQIMADTLAQFQEEINATNAIYADKLKRAQVEGAGRLGNSAAVNARRGLLGSDFGNAATDRVVGANEDVYSGIDNEKQAAVSTLLTAARTAGTAAVAAKRKAKEEGLESYMASLTGAAEASKARAKQLASTILAGKINFEDYDPTTIEEAAKNAGVSVTNIKSSYDELKAARDKEAAELKEIEQKNAPKGFELSPEQRRFEWDEKTGEYKLVAQGGPKTYAPKSGGGSGTGGGGSGSSGKYGSDLDAIIGTTLATIPTKFGQEQFRAQISRARNDADKISTVAAVVLKGQPSQIKADYTNQAVAVSNLDKAIAMLDNNAKTGLINDKLQYTFNVFGKDFDPKLAAINAYITAAIQPYRSSITGAAWGDQEDAEYAQLFGSTKYSPTELKERLKRMKEIMKGKSIASLNAYVNPMDTYANPFIGGGSGGGNVVVTPDGLEVEIID